MKLLAVLPVIVESTSDACVESMIDPASSFDIPKEDILIIDNSKDGFAKKYGVRVYRDFNGHNLGVGRAWNIGAREVLEKGLDYLVMVSASMYFAPYLYHTWGSRIKDNYGDGVIEAEGHGWHLIALHRRLFEQVGLFDENFYPAYFEDVDFSHRLKLEGLQYDWPKVWINAITRGVGVHSRVVSCFSEPLEKYYIKKWGGSKGKEKYKLPFKNKPIGYFRKLTVPKIAKNYKLKNWY